MLYIIFLILLKNFVKQGSCNLTLSSPSTRSHLLQYRDLLAYNSRSIVFIYNKIEDNEDYIEELFGLDIPVSIININRRYTYKREEFYLNQLNVFLLFQRHFNIISLNITIGILKKLPMWKNRDKILIFTNTSSIEDQIGGLMDYLAQHWVINIAYLELEESPVIYIYNPFKKCLTPNFNLEVGLNNVLRDLNGTEISVSLFSDSVNAFRTGNDYGGKDGLTAKTIMKILNARFHYLVPDDGFTFGGVNSTSITGSYRDIIVRRAQMSFNSRLLIPAKALNMVEFTVPHYREDLVALVPKLYQRKDLFGSMPTLIWATSGILSVMTYIYFSIVKGVPNFPDTFLVIVLVLTGRPLRELTTKHFRIFYMSVMVLSLFLNTMFSCNLASFLAVPNDPMLLKTLRDLAESKYKIVTTPSYTVIMNKTLDSDVKDGIVSKIRQIGMRDQKQTILKCEEQVVICKNSLAKLALEEGASVCYVIMKERVIPSLMSYVVNYGSPLLDRLNDIIMRLMENGLHNFWDRKEITVEKQEGYSQIGLDFLYHPFKIYMFGLLFAILTFLFEIFQYRRGKQEEDNDNVTRRTQK